MSDEAEDWSPEKEKQPEDLQRRAIELQERMLKKIEEEEARHQERHGSPAVLGYAMPAQVDHMVLKLQRIKNGFLSVTIDQYRGEGEVEYCPDPAAVRKAVEGRLEAFLGPDAPQKPPPEIPAGT